MPTLQIEHLVRDYDTWKQAFDSDPVGRRQGGVRSYRISRLVEEPLHVLIELDFESVDEAASFAERLRAMWADVGERLGLESPTARIVEHAERVDY